jgi:hypothetical protein
VRLSSAGRPTPTFSAILLNRPTILTIPPAGCPDQGLSRRLAEPSDPRLHRGHSTWLGRSSAARPTRLRCVPARRPVCGDPRIPLKGPPARRTHRQPGHQPSPNATRRPDARRPTYRR